MNTKNHLEMHHDHLFWKSEYGMWFDDLKIWQEELKELNDDLNQIRKAVNYHAESLESHKSAIFNHKLFADKHELDLSLLTEGSVANQELCESHEKEYEKHLAQKVAHEKIKKYHHTVLSVTKGLKKVIEGAM